MRWVLALVSAACSPAVMAPAPSANDDAPPSPAAPMSDTRTPEPSRPIGLSQRLADQDRCGPEVSWTNRPQAACFAADGSRLWAPRVGFDPIAGTITHASFAGLDTVAALLRAYPDVQIQIQGHKEHDDADYMD